MRGTFSGRHNSELGCSLLLRVADPLELFSYHSPNHGLDLILAARNELLERIVDQRLVVASAGLVDLPTEPVENVVIDSNGDARLAFGGFDHRAPFRFAEVVVLAHGYVSSL